MEKLSIVLLTRNEEDNIKECLESIKDLADEIVVLDEFSQDDTVKIARSFGAKIYQVKHQQNFHINKKKLLNLATGNWILQLDADERVSEKLRQEIIQILTLDRKELENYESQLKDRKLFVKHQKLIEKRDGKVGVDKGEYVAFFIPRLNLFLGKFLRYGGVYPDGVIRLVKKGKATFPAKSVHEQIEVDGRVGWLQNPLIHTPDADIKRYLRRNKYYIGLMANEMKQQKVGKNPMQLLNYCLVKPLWWFTSTQFRHKGILDSWQGIVFSFFSALRFPRAYYHYLKN